MIFRFRGAASARALQAAIAASVLAVPTYALADMANSTVSEVLVTAPSIDVGDAPAGQTVSSVSREQILNTPTPGIGDILVQTPGVTFAQGNGPRDVSISIRGSNARQTFGVRNVQVFEDGFPVTQPDGLARTDLTDAHAYERIDVIKGPSSALYGNYATGGAIRFYTRNGHNIEGIEAALDLGDFGYRNGYVALGGAGANYDAAAFGSIVSGSGYTQHTGYTTATINALATYAMGENDRLIFKFINNDLDADLAIRLSYDQFLLNPYQAGCEALAAAGCASVSLFVNGINGAKQSVSALAADLNRNDRRTIVGGRWEHDFSDEVTGRLQLVWDNRDIKQPTSATAAIGTFPSYNLIADISREGPAFGRPSILSAGVFYNTENINSGTYNVPAAGTATLGALTQLTVGTHRNYGARARAEFDVNPQLTLIFGAGLERTELNATSTAYTYPTGGSATSALVIGDRTYSNSALESSIIFRATPFLTLRAHVGQGYGTPQATNLFVTAAGVAGNNTSLEAQKMTGVDLGIDLDFGLPLFASFTVFDEFYTNELVSQSAGANLLSYTFNAPKSEHRGLEFALAWRPFSTALPTLKFDVAALYTEQTYKTYVERLSAGAYSTTFDRSGNRIPGIAPTFVNVRLSYDQETGPLSGLGGYIEVNSRGSWWLDNANILKAPGYTLVNAGARYDVPDGHGVLSRLRFFVTVQNIEDEVYIGSASNVADSISSTTGVANGLTTLRASTGSLYAGPPRTVIGGVMVKF
ncbi:MAG: TonB-dependent receptor [Caulobacteraceae bacterium]